MGLSAQPAHRASRITRHNAATNGFDIAAQSDRGDATRKGEPLIMFDLIPRWALALGIGAISASGVTTVAMESLGTSKPACVASHSAVIDSSTCAKGDAATGALAT